MKAAQFAGVSLVEQILQMHRLLAASRTGHERTALESQFYSIFLNYILLK